MDLRELERSSIRAFVQSAADDGYLSGRVLDYGCGKQPYRDIVEAAGGYYIGYDDPKFPGSTVTKYVGDWSETDPVETILCTQVVQYVPDVWDLLRNFSTFEDVMLVMTYPTNWPEVEPEDLHRFTKAGMEWMLETAGFTIVRHERRTWVRVATGTWETDIQRDEFALGYGVIARA